MNCLIPINPKLDLGGCNIEPTVACGVLLGSLNLLSRASRIRLDQRLSWVFYSKIWRSSLIYVILPHDAKGYQYLIQ